MRPTDPTPAVPDAPVAPSRRTPGGAMALGGAVTVVALLPVFLTGALAVQLMEDLAFGSAGLGLAVAVWRATGAACSPFLGRLCDRLGAIRSIRISTGTATLASLGIALTADRWGTLIAWLMLGGCGHALGQPAANRLLTNVVRTGRLGTAFGIKQSAPPVASMLAGFSVPLVAATWGWRWGYVIAAVLAALVGVAAGRPRGRLPARRATAAARPKLEARGLIVLLAVTFGLGTSTSSAVTTFFVDATVRGGATPQFAGTALAVASFAAISSRVACGVTSDRLRGGHLRLCAGLLGVGALGIALLGVGSPGWMAVAGLIALAGTWGFNGVFWYALMRAFPRSPGQVTGALAPGALLGSTVGPISFGLLVQVGDYRLAWSIVAVVALVAAGAMVFGDRQLAARAQATPA
jgi:MFS family permease